MLVDPCGSFERALVLRVHSLNQFVPLNSKHQWIGWKIYRKAPWSSWENRWFPVKIFPWKPIHWETPSKPCSFCQRMKSVSHLRTWITWALADCIFHLESSHCNLLLQLADKLCSQGSTAKKKAPPSSCAWEAGAFQFWNCSLFYHVLSTCGVVACEFRHNNQMAPYLFNVLGGILLAT